MSKLMHNVRAYAFFIFAVFYHHLYNTK